MSGEVSDEHVFRWLRANERNGRVSEKEPSNTTVLDTIRLEGPLYVEPFLGLE